MGCWQVEPVVISAPTKQPALSSWQSLVQRSIVVPPAHMGIDGAPPPFGPPPLCPQLASAAKTLPTGALGSQDSSASTVPLPQSSMPPPPPLAVVPPAPPLVVPAAPWPAELLAAAPWPMPVSPEVEPVDSKASPQPSPHHKATPATSPSRFRFILLSQSLRACRQTLSSRRHLNRKQPPPPCPLAR